MHDKRKSLILAAAAVLPTLPTKDMMQALKHRPKPVHFFRDALQCFLNGADPSLALIEQAHEHCKMFRKLNDAEFNTQHPDLNALWTGALVTIHSGALQGKDTHMTPALKKEDVLKTLNALRKQRGMSPLTKNIPTVKVMQDRIEKLKKAITKDSIKPFKQGATVVAEGAYANEKEAKHRTGHTQAGAANGKPAAQAGSKAAPPKATRATTKASTDGLISLSDIASELKMEPKTARRKARLHGAEIRKLETSKYKFTAANAAKVKALLATDGRKSK